MKLLEYVDPFFDRQPPLEFVEELKESLHMSPPPNWGRRHARSTEADLRGGVNIINEFEDPEGLLETAHRDFERFLSVHGIPQDGAYRLRIMFAETECFEAYVIAAGPDECVVKAADTEGIRRALVYLEDEMLRREGPYLPLEPIRRKPFIKTRITRCFFSPTNRPPKNEEELSDDVDYYPDEYLNRLAHEGINAVWIYTLFKDLLPSSVIPEYGKDYQRRIDKLNLTISRCARYGIKVYVFGIEPVSTYRSPELLEHHKDMLGQHWGDDLYALCLSNEKGAEYAQEATRTLFTLAPKLGGLIIITVGECNSHCASGTDDNLTRAGLINCPHCAGKPPNQILAEAESILAKGMHSVSPEADFISWRYGQRTWGKERVIESASSIGEDTIYMQNFEDLGEEEQLGRKRVAIDYYLSYVGPSEMFSESAKAAKKAGRRVFAKLQVCCSHEVSSVPYVPVPGILYKKYRAMRELGVDGVLQCWYTGNYPSIMNKAAGELSFEPFFLDEYSFLRHLAGIYWGVETENVVQAWKYFERGYSNFPLNVGFAWYGPMNDAPVWPLQLIPKNLPLGCTCSTYDMVGGDRIGESLMCGHTLDEAVTLCEMMSAEWKEGVALLEQADAGEHRPRTEQKSVASALDYQFESGLNVMRFYQFRELLATGTDNAKACLDAMERIVTQEIGISEKLKALCESDKRLGYHSEGEGYKYFPQKLEWRIGKLRDLLGTEFPEVARRIENGDAPLEYYLAENPLDKKYTLHKGTIEDAPWENFVFEDQSADANTEWRAVVDAEKLYICVKCRDTREGESLQIRSEFKPLWPYPTVVVTQDGHIDLPFAFYFSLYRERLAEEESKWKVDARRDGTDWTVTITVKRCDFNLEGEIRPFRFNIERVGGRTSKWVFSGYYCTRLIFYDDHNEFGWVKFDKDEGASRPFCKI